MDDDVLEIAKAKLIGKHRAEVSAEFQYRRRTRPKQVPYTEEYLAVRADFIRRWEDLTKAGEQAHYLRWTNDYEGSHLEPVTDLYYVDGVEFAENEDEWQQRINREVKIRVNQDMGRLRNIMKSNT